MCSTPESGLRVRASHDSWNPSDRRRNREQRSIRYTVHMGSRSILVVDGEPRVLEAVHRSLSPAGYSVRTSGSAEEGLTLFAASPSEVVISDYAMRGMDGLSFLRRVRELSPHTQRILATRHADLKRIDEKSLEGAVDRYLRKPWDAPALRIVVRS